MSDQGDPAGLDDPAMTDATEPDSWTEEPADDGWSPVMGTPPPGADPVEGPVDLVPPHEQADDGPPPPPPDDPGAGLGVAPPPPPATELPPELPDPIDLGTEGGEDLGAPMPPVAGDVDTAPPAPGEVTLGDDGPPQAPTAPADGAPTNGQTPVPPMGDQGQSPVPPMGDQGQTPVPPMGDQGQTPVPPMGDQGQTPVPDMGGTPPAEGNADPGTGDVDLGDGGPPMPPVTGDTDTAPPGTQPEPDVDLPTDPEPAPATTGTDDEVVMTVTPGDERLSAAAITGAFLDDMDVDDPARDRMIGLLEGYAQDGTITAGELFSAFEQAGFTATDTDGTDQTLGTVLDEGPAARTAVARVEGEGTGVFRVHPAEGVVELESVRTGAVYAVERPALAQAWRDSGSQLVTSPPVEDEPAADPAEAAPAADGDDGGGSGLRNVLVAGAVLLPLAGGATYLATRKVR